MHRQPVHFNKAIDGIRAIKAGANFGTPCTDIPSSSGKTAGPVAADPSVHSASGPLVDRHQGQKWPKRGLQMLQYKFPKWKFASLRPFTMLFTLF